MVRLPDVGDRRPVQLSGGQRQRVALARALINRPPVLLLDEPLGALDLKLRQEMQIELKRLQSELGITFVYVTHDQDEALGMSDRIGVFSAGRLEQVGTPGEIYEHPATEFVAGFVGVSNVLERDGRRVTIRPEKIRILAAGESPEPGWLTEDGAVARGPLPRRRHALRGRAGRRRDAERHQPEPEHHGTSSGRAARHDGPAVLAARAHGRHRIDPGGAVMRKAQVAAVLAALMIVVSACGGSDSSSSGGGGSASNLPTKIGPGEGSLNLVAWEGYTQGQWVKPVRAADRLPGAREVRGLLRRDGHADAPGRRQPVRHGLGLRRRQPAPDPRRGRGRRSTST